MIIGAGMTGLAAGIVLGCPVFEARSVPGGMCTSYYVRPHSQVRLSEVPDDEEVYTFDYGGGHWIFGGEPHALSFLKSLTQMTRYARRSSVYFSDENLLVPYPIQYNLRYLRQELAQKAFQELMSTHTVDPRTMEEWLHQTFGCTLNGLFFAPFHNLYTAGLFKAIAPQDKYKSPFDRELVREGLRENVGPTGYNVSFHYPDLGLGLVAKLMAQRCDIHYGKRLVSVDMTERKAVFADGSAWTYDHLITSVPLNQMCTIADLSLGDRPSPYTSVLVVNVGGRRGRNCPQDQWLYIPRSKSGFHRVGFYSNVSRRFLPKSARVNNDHVSMYIERSFVGGAQLSDCEIDQLCQSMIKELIGWGFLENTEVVNPTWIDVAYTWSRPGDNWATNAIAELEAHNILPVGRYARWTFQGIADSIRDGFAMKQVICATATPRELRH